MAYYRPSGFSGQPAARVVVPVPAAYYESYDPVRVSWFCNWSVPVYPIVLVFPLVLVAKIEAGLAG